MPTPSHAAGLVRGIDVSHYQGAIDWSKVAAAGAQFAFIKASDGLDDDNLFRTNWQHADGKLRRGAYHFFRPLQDPIRQAECFLQTMGALRDTDLSPVVDIEESIPRGSHTDQWLSVPKADRRDLVGRYLVKIYQETGRSAFVYTRKGFWDPVIGTLKNGGGANFDQHPLWVAHYTTAPKPALPQIWADWKVWQYSESGQIGGISGSVDLDRWNGSLP